MEPADIALLLEESGPELMPLLYRLLPKETAAEVFVELEPESQEMLINGFSNTELKEVLDELYLDDAVDIVEEMPASVVIRILDKATPEMRKSINEILKYPEDSAGSIMNMEFLSLKKDMTVEDAFKRIRRIGGELETINILYVTDPTRRLLGVLSVRDLLLANEDDIIEDIMDPDVVWARTMDDKEDVAQALAATTPPLSLTGGEEDGSGQIDLPEEGPEELLSDLLSLQQLLSSLEERDRQLIFLRYYRRKTQTEVARRLGMTQVQVSRREKRILQSMRQQLLD